MRISKSRIALTLALVLGLTCAGLSAFQPSNASAADVTVQPDSGQGCAGKTTPKVCLNLTGSGKHVDTVKVGVELAPIVAGMKVHCITGFWRVWSNDKNPQTIPTHDVYSPKHLWTGCSQDKFLPKKIWLKNPVSVNKTFHQNPTRVYAAFYYLPDNGGNWVKLGPARELVSWSPVFPK